MRSETRSVGRQAATFTEAARRAQIIDAAIIAVNEVGYARASLSQIAARAGTSKSVISYHFNGKEELLEKVVTQVYHEIGEVVAAAVAQQPTWAGKLTAYIRAELGVLRDHRDRMLAATEIVTSHRGPDGTPLYLQAGDDRQLTSILEGGRLAGEFGVFDPSVAATTIIHAIDGALMQSLREPATDLDAYASRLSPLLLRMVGAAGAATSTTEAGSP